MGSAFEVDRLFEHKREFSRVLAEFNKKYPWDKSTKPERPDNDVIHGCLACIPEEIVSKLSDLPNLASRVAYLSSKYDPRVEYMQKEAQIELFENSFPVPKKL